MAAALQLRPTRLFAFAGQLTTPGGFWVRACDGEVLPYKSFTVWGEAGRAA